MEKFNISNRVKSDRGTLTAAAAPEPRAKRVREFEGRKHTPMSLEEIVADTDCVNVYAVYILEGAI